VSYPGCGKKTKSGKHRKHTPIVSKSQMGAFGSAYGAKKAGKGKPSKTPSSIWAVPISQLRAHLKEVGKGGKKKLPKKVRKRK